MNSLIALGKIFLQLFWIIMGDVMNVISTAWKGVPALRHLHPNMKKEPIYYSRKKGLECLAPLFMTVEETPEPIPVKVKGEIPKWLRGNLLRNGPGKFEFGNDKYNHWFDGMALMHQFKIEDGNVTYMSKFLRSEAYRTNSTNNRIMVSEFGTVAMPDPCKNIFKRFISRFEILKATDNDCVNFARYEGDYYATTETNFIHKVNPSTLETEEKVDWTKFIAVNGATAHPHYDPDGTTYNMGNSYGKNGTIYNIIAVPPQKSDDEETLQGARIVCGITPVDRMKPSYYHSFGMTKNYIIFVEQPLKINVLKILTAKLIGKSLNSAINWEPELNTIIHVANKHTGEVLPFKYYTKAFSTFHHINAFEDNGFIVFDLCCFDSHVINSLSLQTLHQTGEALDEVYNTLPRGFPHRFVLPLKIDSKTPIEQNLNTLTYSTAVAFRKVDGMIWCESENLHDDDLLEEGSMEFPQINYAKYNTKKYKFFYGCGANNIMVDSLIKMDVETKKFKTWKEKGYYASEPVFVPSPNCVDEDDGVILSVVVSPNPNKSSLLLVLDAKTFTEVGRAEVAVRIPFGFHGVFAES